MSGPARLTTSRPVRHACALFALALFGCAADEAGSPAAAPLELVREDPSDAPIAGLDPVALARFAEGDGRFEHPFRESQGLGPVYVHRSCESCHEGDGRGPGSVQRIVPRGAALEHGDVVRPRVAGGGRTPVSAPPGATVVLRLGPPLFARGYLEAIADETLLGYERAQAARDDGIHGRAHRVARRSAVPLPDWLPRLGRFGHKARIASLPEFVADALVSDMGLTSPLRPEELPNPDGLRDDARPGIDLSHDEVDAIADYVRLLARPREEDDDARAVALFEETRCAVCHVPRVTTRADHPVRALAGVTVALFTDLLLHDMGEGLADGITEGEADGRTFRTAALVGVRHQRRFLHDGRAPDVETAIRLHASPGSEARDAVSRFEALSEEDRGRLVRYVEGR